MSSARVSQFGAPHAAQSLRGNRWSRASFSRLRAIAWRRSRASGRTWRARISDSMSKKWSRRRERTFSSLTAPGLHPPCKLPDVALGQVAARHGQLAADASAGADVRLDEVEPLERARFDAVEDVDDVAQPADRDRVGVAHRRDLAARHRPAQPARADHLGQLGTGVVLDRLEELAIDLGDRERAVEVRSLEPLGVPRWSA